jgi:hypothetical protein
MLKPKLIVFILMLSFLLPSPLFAASVYQDTNRFAFGFQRVVMAPFQIPLRAMEGTAYGPMLVGTVGGVLKGTFRTVGDVVGGSFDMAAAAAPYAKYAVFI